MKYRILPVKNVARMQNAGEALITRSLGMPGMGLIWGPTGYGKTTAATWFINQCHGVYVRALRLSSPKSLLSSIARELDYDPGGRNNGEIVERIVQRLAETGRPLFIDEADYIVESRRLIDTLRDIHDLSTVPVILIGMHGIEKRIRGNEQFTGRIAQWVDFQGADFEDAELLANGLCEVSVATDLLQELYKAASPRTRAGEQGGAEIRRLVVGLGNIERYALGRGKQKIARADWPSDKSFFIGSPIDPAAGRASVTRLRHAE